MKDRNQFNHLKDIILSIDNRGVDFIICGGVALALHGIERMTMDIDIALNMQKENILKLLAAIHDLGMTPRMPVPAESLLDPEIREKMVNEKNALVFTFIDFENPYKQVDIFITDKVSYDSLKNSIETVTIENKKIKLVSKKMLLKMKKSIKPMRDKDEFDIRALEKILKNNG